MKQHLHLIFLLLLSAVSTVSYSHNKSSSSIKDTLLHEEWSKVEREYELRLQVLSELQEYLSMRKSYKELSVEIQDELANIKEKQKDLNGTSLADRKLIATVQNTLTRQVEKWLSIDLANDKNLEKDENYRRIKIVSKGMKTRIAVAVNIYNKKAREIEHPDLVLEGAENFSIPQVEF
jgi:hypothetical protein